MQRYFSGLYVNRANILSFPIHPGPEFKFNRRTDTPTNLFFHFFVFLKPSNFLKAKIFALSEFRSVKVANFETNWKITMINFEFHIPVDSKREYSPVQKFVRQTLTLHKSDEFAPRFISSRLHFRVWDSCIVYLSGPVLKHIGTLPFQSFSPKFLFCIFEI